MITIDGSQGEGGGQILRTALSLSLITGTPFRILNIRARRKRPGLMRQHLTALQAAAQVGDAEVEGAAIGSAVVTFRPKAVRSGDYRFEVGTAGSTSLVLQTVLPALLTARGGSTIELEGGTHNPMAPPFDFLAKAFIPLVNRMGPTITATLERPGFYPAGGGRCRFVVEPAERLRRIDLPSRGEVRRRSARAMVSNLPTHIAERELRVVGRRLGWDESCLKVETVGAGRGPGNVVTIEIESEHVTEVFTGFGQHRVPAEAVAAKAVDAAGRYLASDAAVGEHLADQLLLPMALAGGGSFRTLPLSGHTRTNIDVVRTFCDVEISVDTSSDGSCVVAVGAWRPARRGPPM